MLRTKILISLTFGAPGQNLEHLWSRTKSLMVIKALPFTPACHTNISMCALHRKNGQPCFSLRAHIPVQVICTDASIIAFPCHCKQLSQFKEENETCQSFLPLWNNEQNQKKLAWLGTVQHCVSVIDHHSNHHGVTSILFHQFNFTYGKGEAQGD